MAEGTPGGVWESTSTATEGGVHPTRVATTTCHALRARPCSGRRQKGVKEREAGQNKGGARVSSAQTGSGGGEKTKKPEPKNEVGGIDGDTATASAWRGKKEGKRPTQKKKWSFSAKSTTLQR
jgi:hypothetical protein